MKSFNIIFSSLLLIFFQTLDLKSQWSPSLGLEGVNAWDVSLHNDSMLFITTSNGLYRQNLSTYEWEFISNGGCGESVLSNGSYLFSCGPMCSLTRSDDNGESWEEIEEFPWLYYIDISGPVIIACNGQGAYRSEDNGDNWTQLGQYSDYGYCNIFICDSMVLFNDLDLGTLWISVDLGITFNGLTLNGLSSNWINDFYTEEGELFLGHHDGVFHYNGTETKWLIFGDTLPANTNVSKLFKYNDSLRFISNKGYFAFNQADSGWIPNNDGLESFNLNSADFYDSVIFAITSKGPFFKENNEPWQADYQGLYQRQINQILPIDSILFTLTQDGLYSSEDNGSSFELYPTLNYPGGGQMVITDSAYYLATSQGFAVSIDKGYSWTFNNEGLPAYKNVNRIAISDYYIYTGLGSGLYRSLIKPIGWSNVFSGNCSNVVAKDSIVILILDNGNEGLFRSADYGLTFSAVSLPGIGVPDEVIRLSETDDKVFVLADKPYFTTDWGITWKYYPFNDDFIWLECVEEFDEIILVGGGGLNPIFPQWLVMSEDQGNTWNDISGGLPFEHSYPSILQCIISNNRIIAYPSGNSLWYRDDLITGIYENNKPGITDLEIFPNPFDDILNISLPDQVPQSSHAKIYDMTGRLVYQENPVSQMKKMAINTTRFLPGIYILNVQCPGEVYSAKLFKY